MNVALASHRAIEGSETNCFDLVKLLVSTADQPCHIPWWTVRIHGAWQTYAVLVNSNVEAALTVMAICVTRKGSPRKWSLGVYPEIHPQRRDVE